MSERRLLLLELVTGERWLHNSRNFPFLKGAAEALGIEALWLCFGSRFRGEKTGAAEVSQHMELGDAEMALLRDKVEGLRPTHVALSDPVPPEALELLHEVGADVLSLSDSYPQYLNGQRRMVGLFEQATGKSREDRDRGRGATSPEAERPYSGQWISSRSDWVLAWLGETGETSDDFGRYLADAFVPSYDAVMANAAAREHEPSILLLGGVSCDHFVPVADNAFFEGVDISASEQQYGCAYCTHFRGATSDLDADPVELAVRQLRRVVETAGRGGRGCGRYEVCDIRLFRDVGRFAEAVLGLDLPPSRFFFEPRLDRFLEVADALDAVLPRLAEAGHVIALLRMGIENLVEEENERFNKLITPETVDAARARLAELARKHPRSFEYDPTHGYITCSPWTTLEMLQTGIERAIERGFPPYDIWLFTPLMLYRGSPMTELARYEGHTVARAEDLSLLYEPAVGHMDLDSFVHWRFADERTAVAFALMVRFYAAVMRDKHPDTIFEGDELYGWLRLALAQRDGPFDRPDLFAREAALAVAEAEPPYDRALLVEVALDAYEDAVRALSPTERGAAAPSAPSVGEREVAPPQDPERQKKLTYLLGALKDRYPDRFGDLAVVRAFEDPRRSSISLHLTLGETPYELDLIDTRVESRGVFRTDHFCVVHASSTPIDSPRDRKILQALVKMLDAVLTRYAAEILPGGSGGGRG